MIMTSDAASIYSVRRLSRRPQFSVLALLLFVTLFCLLLASGVFYFAQQRKERERIAQDLDRLNAEISQKWVEFIQTARETERSGRDLKRRLEKSYNFGVRAREIEQLQQSADELSARLEKMGGKPGQQSQSNR
jgi:Tfp pilus assembly protein PilN